MVSLSADQLQSYFKSLVRNFQGSYISTDLAGHQDQRDHHVTSRLQLKVNRVLSKEEQEDGRVEALPVLEGLRKYQWDHVLLIGKPGSGKSTSLERLLLEEAQICQNQVSFDGQIPVLLKLRKLRSYSVSIISMIQTFLKTYDLNLTHDEIQKLLDNGNFLLLMDGLNELPDDNARQELINFRDLYKHKIPMIFTTRDISLGGTFGITKQLQMNSLTDAQMKEFIKAELHIDGAVMLRNLGDKLRKFAETPLFLWMLCQVYDPEMKQLPNNLAETFQLFTQMYDDEFKYDVSVDVKSKEWQTNLLQYLAFQMMQTDSLTDFRLEIDIDTVENILTDYLKTEGLNQPRSQAKLWLKDLLKYHLIQAVSIKKIEFRHQLIQEYYAAEFLKKQLEELTDKKLKWDFLNYTKWTETIALMLGLLNDESQLQRIVKLTLEIDLKLGARFAGEVKNQFQKKTVKLVSDIIDVPKLFKIYLLGMTRSDEVIDELVKNLEDENKDICRASISSLCQIKTKRTIKGLLIALKSSDWLVRCNAADALGQIGTNSEIAELQKAFKCSHWKVRFHVERALQELDVDVSIEEEFNIKENYDFSDEYDEYYILDNYDDSWVWCEPSSISQKDSDRSIPHLLESLKSHSFLTRKDAAFFLGEIGSEEIVPDLIISLKDSDSFVCGTATEALIKIGKQNTLVNLFEILKNPTFIHANNGSAFYYAYSVITAIQNKLKYYQPLPSTMTTSKIYISYAWQGESETIAQQIEETLQKKGLTIIRDKNGGLGYKGLITEFMDLLGQAECIILIIAVIA